MAVTKQAFGKMPDGRDVNLYTITNTQGMQVKLTDLGAAIVSVILKDKNGKETDVVLGYDNPEAYLSNGGHFGGVIGRSGNRIDKGHFRLGEKEYQLELNNNENNLHSGPKFFDHRLWRTEQISDDSVSFFLQDADMEQGYPGNFQVSVTYTLTEDGALRLHYEGESDQDTVANMTNHVYFNLAGHDSGDVLEQEIMLTAKSYTPVRDQQAIPTGEIAPVAGTPMDFTSPKKIGEEINADFEQISFGGGYDHNFVLKDRKGKLEKFAEAFCPETGICLEAFTDLPGVQFYTGNFIGDREGKGGAIYRKRQGFCLESQYYPNSINQEGFEKPILRAGEKYDTTTCYAFSVRDPR